MAVAEQGREGFRRGLTWGFMGGLALGVPAGAALKVAGYPSDELYAWWILLGAVVAGTLVVSAIIAVRHAALAAGLALGTTAGIALAPLAVVIDIVTQSA